VSDCLASLIGKVIMKVEVGWGGIQISSGGKSYLRVLFHIADVSQCDTQDNWI
jgi:hypothetical protein